MKNTGTKKSKGARRSNQVSTPPTPSKGDPWSTVAKVTPFLRLPTRLKSGGDAYRSLLVIGPYASTPAVAAEIAALTSMASTTCTVAIHSASPGAQCEDLLHTVSRLCDLAHGLASELAETIEKVEMQSRGSTGAAHA